MEGRGVPAVVLGTHEFLPLGRAEAASRGVADLCIVTGAHPIGGIAPGAVAAKAAGAVGAVAEALAGSRRGAPAAGPSASAPRGHAAPDDLDAFQAWALERGWG